MSPLLGLRATAVLGTVLSVEGNRMFERVKYVVGFAGSYRQSRRNGADHGDALDTAARDMMLRKLDGDETTARCEVPESVAMIWIDPEPVCALADGSLEVTAAHIDLLRQIRLGWDGAERGAPMLDPRRPYGRTDVLAQLAETFDTEDYEELARRHVEMMFVLARLLRHGTLAPGRYPLGTLAAEDVRRAMRGYDATDEDLGLGDGGRVEITEDHLSLLREIDIRWPSVSDCEDRIDAGRYPAATVDAKRPYGDMTHIEIDMARILDVLPPAPDGGIFEPEPELAQRLQRLHWQMLVAMQVFVEHADLAPGVYR